MNSRIQNELSDAQLDAISGGSYSRDCGGGGGRGGRDNDCDDHWKKSCGDEQPRKHYRDNDDCRPTYRPRRSA